MKITTEPPTNPFQPVTITLETPTDAMFLLNIINRGDTPLDYYANTFVFRASGGRIGKKWPRYRTCGPQYT